jgi:hypothetical protein
MNIFAQHDGRNDRWPIGRSINKPSHAVIQRAGIDSSTVIRIKQVHGKPRQGGHYWLVLLPRDSREAGLR